MAVKTAMKKMLDFILLSANVPALPTLPKYAPASSRHFREIKTFTRVSSRRRMMSRTGKAVILPKQCGSVSV